MIAKELGNAVTRCKHPQHPTVTFAQQYGNKGYTVEGEPNVFVYTFYGATGNERVIHARVEGKNGGYFVAKLRETEYLADGVPLRQRRAR